MNTAPRIPDTDQGRIARVLAAEAAEARLIAVQKARLYYAPPCKSCTGGGQGPNVPTESSLLKTRASLCTPFLRPAPTSESVRIAAVQQCVLDKSTNPLNPDARFSEFRGPFVATVCPPVPQEVLNANVPKNQLKSCPLPNKPDNLVLPG